MKIVRIEDAIKKVHSLPESWVRVEQVLRIPTGLEICMAIHRGRRGKKAEGLRITCRGIREFRIYDVDGGGLALYPRTHPAARQFLARKAVLRWGSCDCAAAIGELCQAHMDAVDDWIPIDRYVNIRAIEQEKFVCRGPDFLMRAYAKRLRFIGAQPRLVLQRRKMKSTRLRVLHFGSSHVVARIFIAEPRA
jgi:hypothetical protein